MATTLPRIPKTKLSAAKAAKRASEQLGLSDEKSLTIAILEASIEEMNKNSRFADKIKGFYDALVMTQAPKSFPGSKEEKRFTPIKTVVGLEINIAVTPDPFLMCEAYGPEQFRQMLENDTKARVLDNIRLIQKKHPDLKAPNKAKSSKYDLIDFIISHVSEYDINSE